MRIAFLGTGSMGMPMARNLLRAGHKVAAWNRTAARAEPLAADGATIARTPAEALEGADAAVTMLADDAAVEAVVFGDGGIVEALPAGAAHLSMSTVSVAFAGRLAEAHGARGQSFVSAPVFGRPEAAEAARLKIVAAGDLAAVARFRPLLEALGERVFVVGEEPPAANVVKLCGNFLIASMIESLGEAFALARKSGIESADLLEVLNGTFFGTPIFGGYAKNIAEERFDPPGFRMRLGLKDVRLVLQAADAAGAPMPVASLLHDRLLAGTSRGRGDLDWAALAALAAEDAGL
jgi:3-hydroxyisobutyrate dehydrogenase-like beta-hydroxyacid dehydrogenase